MSNNLINILIREAIGYDMLSSFVDAGKTSNYPPYNIIKLDESQYNLTLAVAGFKRSELTVTVNDGQLSIAGSRNRELPPGKTEIEYPRPEMLYQGLAFRDFERSWKLGEYVEVVNVTLEDGIMTVLMERKIPEAKKARTITIS